VIESSFPTDYFFTTRDEMQQMIVRGEFIETAEFSSNLYGTSKRAIQVHVRACVCVEGTRTHAVILSQLCACRSSKLEWRSTSSMFSFLSLSLSLSLSLFSTSPPFYLAGRLTAC
jgi:hypothetical protein